MARPGAASASSLGDGDPPTEICPTCNAAVSIVVNKSGKRFALDPCANDLALVQRMPGGSFTVGATYPHSLEGKIAAMFMIHGCPSVESTPTPKGGPPERNKSEGGGHPSPAPEPEADDGEDAPFEL